MSASQAGNMGRRVFDFISTLSLLAFLLLLVFWAGGFHYLESHTAKRFVTVTHRDDHVGLFVYRKNSANDYWDKQRTPVEIVAGNAHAFLDTERNFLDLQAGTARAVTPDGKPMRAFVAVAPLWLLCVGALLLPGVRLLLYARGRCPARRARLGLCAKCGYDLRESPGRCPECGALPAAAGG